MAVGPGFVARGVDPGLCCTDRQFDRTFPAAKPVLQRKRRVERHLMVEWPAVVQIAPAQPACRSYQFRGSGRGRPPQRKRSRDIDAIKLSVAVGEAKLHKSRRHANHIGEISQLQDVDIIVDRSEEPKSELQSLMRISYTVFCFKNNNKKQ